jgi:hypothetical protein
MAGSKPYTSLTAVPPLTAGISRPPSAYRILASGTRFRNASLTCYIGVARSFYDMRPGMGTINALS